MGQADRVVWQLANEQGRVCTRQQLIEAGVSQAAVSRRIRSGLLVPLRPGLFAVGGPADHDALLAAALLAMPGAAVSHASAAARHGMATARDSSIHVTVPRGRTHDLSGVVVHESRYLPDADVMVLGRLRVTTPARTLVDLAAALRPRALRHLVERQLADARPTADELVACHRSLGRRGRPGVARLRAVLDGVLDDEPFPESQLELALLHLLMRAGITGFRRQFRPPWYDGRRGTVDFAHVGARLVLEADGRRWHATSQAFDDDRRRDRLAVAEGWRVVRFGWQEITRRPDEVAGEVRALVHAGPDAAAASGGSVAHHTAIRRP